MRTDLCFDVATYQRMFAGQLPATEMDTVCEHLEKCERCLQVVRTFPEDTLVASLRGSAQGPATAVGSAFVRDLAEKVLKKGGGGLPEFILFFCGGCGNKLKVKKELAGKKVKCPKCGEVMLVPAEVVFPAGANLADEKTRAPQDATENLDAHTLPPADRQTLVPASKVDTNLANQQGAAHEGDAENDRNLIDFLAPPQQSDEIGRLGSYRVLKILGAGGMGVVFKAEDPSLKRLVAIKAMLPAIAASASAKKRFLREAQAAAAIKHDHIVTIHQVGEDDGVPFLAMEFLEGEPLDDRLKRAGTLPLADVLRIGREMAEGLAAAHERGLIHRDIKPANVWLEASPGRKSGEPRVKILDFGLARAADDAAHLTQSGAIVGTPAFMAPEQAQGKNVDPRCDLFSLGCVLYRMSTGEMPFRGTDMISTLMAVATENPAPPVSLNFELPVELSDFIMQLLAKKPEERPASAQEVADTLSRIADAEEPSRTGQAGARQNQAKVSMPGAGRRGRHMAVAVLALALLVPLGYWLSGIIVRVESKEGTLVIKTEDPSVVVKVTSEGGATLTYGKDRREIQLKPGKYGIELDNPKDGFKLSATQLTIASGENKIVEVFWEKKQDAPAKTTVAVKPPVEKKAETPPIPASVPADALRRADIPEAVLTTLGGGDPKRAPAELVAVLGEGRFRLTDTSRFPAYSPDGTLIAVPNGGEVILFDANSGKLLRRFRGRAGRVCSVAFSPNGAILAMGDEAIVRLLNPHTGVLLQDLAGHAHNFILGLAFTADNKTVLSCSEDNTVRVWDVATGRQTRVLSCKAGVNSVAITPDGRLAVAGAHDGRVYGWSPDTGAEKFVFEVGKQARAWVSISADGQWLAGGTNDKFKVWKIADLAKKDLSPFFEKQTPAGWLQFEKNSNKLWTAEHGDPTTDNRACRWDPASGQLVSSVTLRSSKSPWMVYALSPDDGTLAALGHLWDRTMLFYDTQIGKPRFPDPGHTTAVKSVAFSPDGRWLASGSDDGMVRIWDLATGTPRHKLEGHTGAVGWFAVAFSPDGKLLASGGLDGTIVLWDPLTGLRVRTLNGYFHGSTIQFSSDGKLVAAGTADGGVRMWYTRNGEDARMLKGLHEGHVRCLAFRADGQRLATGGDDGKLVITDLASGTVLDSFKRDTRVIRVEFSADGETVAAAYGHPEPVARLWNLKDKDFVNLKGHTENVHTVSLRSDGRLAVTTAHDGSVRLWEIGGNLPRKMVLGLGMVGERLWSGALSPDGRYVATGNSNGTVYLFRLPGPTENIGTWLAARGSPPPGLSHGDWLKRVQDLQIGNVADAVADRLCELNPGFAGPDSFTIEDGVVTGLGFRGNVKDIAPLRALPGLQRVGFSYAPLLVDLSPVRGMKLTDVFLWGTSVSDLSPLKGMPLTNLHCGYTQVADLKPLIGLPLTHLQCNILKVSDLTPLKGMHLTLLNCNLTKVSDLTPLKDMKLTSLFFGNTQVPDAGLRPLQEMSSLRELDISGPMRTDAGLEHLTKLTDLEQLSVVDAKLTGAGLVHLKGMTRLRHLDLDNTTVPDEGLVHLKGLLGLRILVLNKTRVTDAGLEHLAGLKNLAELKLNGTAVTGKGVAKLKAALPKCNISADVKVSASEPAAAPQVSPPPLEALRRDQNLPEAS